MTAMDLTTKGEITGRKVLTWVLLFFGTIIGVNIVFAYYALHTFPGLIDNHAYLDGLKYNSTLAAAAAQKQRGWKSTVTIETEGRRGAVLDVTLSDRAGNPITGMTVKVDLRRPANADLDRKLTLKEGSPGHYSAGFHLPARGLWAAAIDARTTDGQSYRMTHEFEVTP